MLNYTSLLMSRLTVDVPSLDEGVPAAKGLVFPQIRRLVLGYLAKVPSVPAED